jgi:hypothetical protein
LVRKRFFVNSAAAEVGAMPRRATLDPWAIICKIDCFYRDD